MPPYHSGKPSPAKERKNKYNHNKHIKAFRGQRRAIIFGGSPRDKKVLMGYEGVYSFEPVEGHGGRFYISSRGRKSLWD